MEMFKLEMFKLRNGAEILASRVRSIMRSLNLVQDLDPTVIPDLYAWCLDSEDPMTINSRSVLSRFSLLESDGSVPEDVRTILLCAWDPRGGLSGLGALRSPVDPPQYL